MKKILLSLGTLATIAAPVAAVISCGTTQGGTLGGHTETPSEKALRELMEGSSTALQAWSMTTEDITNYISTTKTEGIIDNLDTYMKAGVDTNAQFVDPTKPVFEKQFTKQDVIDQQADDKTGTLFEDVAASIKAKQKAGKQYGMVVAKVKADATNPKGSFKVSVFEKKAFVAPKDSKETDIQTSVDIIKDPSHFAFDNDRIAEMHGTYVFGEHHSGGGSWISSLKATPLTSNGISGFLTNTSNAPIYHDRIQESNLYTWTMLKAQDGGNLDGASIADAMYVQNKKDDKFYLRLELVKGGQSSTVYLVNDAITGFTLPTDGTKMDRDWMVNKFDDDAFKKLWDEEFGFQKVYALFNTMKSQASSLESMSPLKEMVIDISASINILASSDAQIHQSDIYDKFLVFLKAKYSADQLNHLIVGLQDFKMNNDGKMYTSYMPAMGAKGYNGLIWSRNLLETYTEFIDAKVADKTITLNKISSADDFKKALDAAKALAVEAKVAKQYMDDNSIAYAATDTDGDVVKQVKDLMATNLATARALPAVMTPITASDDGHLKDAFDALIKEITKQDKVETKDMNIKALTEYVAKDVKLHEGIAKINAAIVSINADATFDTKASLKEIQILGVKIPGLVSINVPTAELNAFVAKAKVADDSNGVHSWMRSRSKPSDKLKLFEDFIEKNIKVLFGDYSEVNHVLGGNGFSSFSKYAIDKGSSLDDVYKGIKSEAGKGSYKLSLDDFKIIDAIYTLIA